MEARLNESAGGERLAVLALGAIIVITMVWWMLALWPVDVPPAWLSRTRSVCFGSGPGGLPDGGGWILLAGQPSSMLAFLMLVWGRAVVRGLRSMALRGTGRVVLVSGALLIVAGGAGAVTRVAESLSAARGVTLEPGHAMRLDRAAPSLSLTDQHGARFSLAAHRGRRILLTFAYGHCETLCPLTVHEALAARAGIEVDPPIVVVVTLDPWRDTPSRLASIARQWALGEDDFVLGGDTAAVLEVLDRWDVHVSRDPDTGTIDHASIAYVIDATGHVAWGVAGGLQGLPGLIREAGHRRPHALHGSG